MGIMVKVSILDNHIEVWIHIKEDIVVNQIKVSILDIHVKVSILDNYVEVNNQIKRGIVEIEVKELIHGKESVMVK